MKITMTAEEKIAFVAEKILDQSKLMVDERNFSLKIYKFACSGLRYDDVYNILKKFAKEGILKVEITNGMYGDIGNTSVVSLSNIQIDEIRDRSMKIEKNDSKDIAESKRVLNNLEGYLNKNDFHSTLKILEPSYASIKRANEDLKNSIKPSLRMSKESLDLISEQAKKNLQPISNTMDILKDASSPFKETDLDMSFMYHNPELEVLTEIRDKLNIKEEKTLNQPGENTKNVVYEIKYSEHNRNILLNGILIAHPNFNTANEKFFTYIYSKPNQRISMKEIQKQIEWEKDIHKIISELNFTGNLKKIFFNASTESVEFRNPITREILNELDIEYIKFKSLS